MRAAISVINMKGGVGKTTIATLLCQRFARSHRVLAIDLDPQANMSQALMGETGYRRFLVDESPSVVEVFKGFQPPGNASSPTPLDPAEVAQTLRRVGGKLCIVPSRFDFSDNLCEASRADPHALARFIAAGFHDFELVLIDCAPTESISHPSCVPRVAVCARSGPPRILRHHRVSAATSVVGRFQEQESWSRA